MRDQSTSGSWSSWRGSRAYIVTALVASAANAGSLNRLSTAVSPGELNDVRDLLNSLTVVTLAAFFVQFVMARSLGRGHRLKAGASVVPALCSAVGAGLVSFFLVQSTDDYRTAVAGAISLFTFLAIAVSAKAATLLANARWAPICSALVGSTTARLILFQVGYFNSSPIRILGALIAGQVVGLAVIWSAKVTDLDLRHFRFRAFASVPAGILGSYLALIASATIARAGSLGGDKQVLITASTPARSTFFLATSVAYAAFPMISGVGLFSRELGKRFREAQIAVTILVAILLSATASGIFTGHDIRGVIDSGTPHSLALTLGIGWGFVALALMPTLFYVAHNSRIGLMGVVPAMMMVLGQVLCTTAHSLANVFLASSIVLAAIAMVPALVRTRPVIHPERTHSSPEGEVQSGDIVIVVPSFNSGTAGAATVRSVHEVLSSEGIEVSVIAVSDGSTDESVALFDQIDEPWFEHITLPTNRGKGGALKSGFERAHGSVVGFIDADGDIPPSVLPGMFRVMRNEGADVVFGSKWHPDSKVGVSSARKFISRVQRLVQLVLFRIDIDDTQVGVKLYNGKMLADVLPTLHENGFSLDLEIFVSAVAHGYTKFSETPVVISRKGGSTVSFGSVAATIMDIFRIYWRSRIALAYNAMAYENAQLRGSTDQ